MNATVKISISTLCSTENTIQLKEILRIIALTTLNKEAILKERLGLLRLKRENQ